MSAVATRLDLITASPIAAPDGVLPVGLRDAIRREMPPLQRAVLPPDTVVGCEVALHLAGEWPVAYARERIVEVLGDLGHRVLTVRYSTVDVASPVTTSFADLAASLRTRGGLIVDPDDDADNRPLGAS